MKELLQEYKDSLQLTLHEISLLETGRHFKSDVHKRIKDPAAYFEVLKAAESDLRFVIGWIEKGSNTHYRGVEKRDAYNVGSNDFEREKKYQTIHAMDHMLMEYFIEDKQSQQPFETVINEDDRTIEEKEACAETQFEMSISYGTERLYNAALKILIPIEKQILMLHLLCKSQEEIAEMIGTTQQAVSKRIKRIKKKLLEIGIERNDL